MSSGRTATSYWKSYFARKQAMRAKLAPRDWEEVTAMATKPKGGKKGGGKGKPKPPPKPKAPGY